MPSSKLNRLADLHRKRGTKAVLAKVFQRLFNPPKILHDDYVAWLNTVIAGLYEPGNSLLFDHAFKNLPEGTAVLEIGSLCGLSTNVLTHFKKKHSKDNVIFTCDKWDFTSKDALGPVDVPASIRENAGSYIKDTFINNCRTFSSGDLPHAIELYSDDFFEAWSDDKEMKDVFDRDVKLGGPLGFCFIDGNHSYDFVLRDFENCDRFLVKDGFILFDDSADGSDWDVCDVVRSVKNNSRYELVMKNPNYLFKKLT